MEQYEPYKWIRHDSLWAITVLTVVVNLFLFPFIWGNKTVLLSARGAPSITPGGAASTAPALTFARTSDPGAPAWYFEPLLAVMGRAYAQEKTLPLWNPYSGYGAPLAAAMQPQGFHPMVALLSLDPTATTTAVFLAARLLIAGVFTYLFLRLFVPFLPAISGAIAYMCTGYFLMYLNMFHLTVEMMLPALFYAFECLLRNCNARSIALSCAVILLSIIGGAPESTFLILFFAYVYYLYRLATVPVLRSRIMASIGSLAVVNVIGFGAASFLLACFVEFLSSSFSLHAGSYTPGLASPILYRDLFGYLIPLVEGPPGMNLVFGGHNGVSGYFGITATVMAVLAVVTWIADRRAGTRTESGAIVPLFAIAAILMILKRCGSPLVQWVGFLPFFRMIALYKYLEPLIAFCVACLCGIGFSYVMRKRTKAGHIAMAVGIVFGIFVFAYSYFLPSAAGLQKNSSIFFESTTAGLLVLVVISVILLVAAGSDDASSWRNRKGWCGCLLAACLTGELFLVFVYPLFYKYSEQPDKAVNAFAGAPYVSWLQQRDPKTFRVFAENGLLYPNWAGVFGLYDVRNLDAIYVDKYLPFVRAFFRPDAVGADLFDRFTGAAPNYSFASAASKRFLQLSSVKYIVTDTPLQNSSLAAEFVDRAKAVPVKGEYPLAETNWTINGETKHVLFQHPPSSLKGISKHIAPGKTDLSFSVALDPSGYGGTCGDGAEFMLYVRDKRGMHLAFDRFINPYGNPGDRRWFDGRVSLKDYVGQDVDILVGTGPGPKGDNCKDWAGWGDLRLGAPEFPLVYNKEVQIYENPSMLPRASVFYSAELEATDDGVLKRLVDPSFDLFRCALISSSGLKPGMKEQIAALNGAPPLQATPAKIAHAESREVNIDIPALPRSGILVLNDTDYPGWLAFVDGRPASVVNVDYLFRGVLVPPGTHHVQFRYEPRSFHFGVMLSALSIASLGLLLTYRARRGDKIREIAFQNSVRN